MGSIKKILQRAFVIYIKIKEKVFIKGDKTLKYLLINNPSDCLVISFSAFASEKKSAYAYNYNYIRTLSGVKINKLFILDDFGYEKRGSYYLGENGDFYVADMVIELIEKLKSDRNIKKVICVGSSKGGTAAIYFGLRLGVDYIVAGTPQYYLGNYLNINDKQKKILESIIGKIDHESIGILNTLVSDVINNYSFPNKPKICIHYSNNEHTYPEHIIYLLHKLKSAGFTVVEDIEKYTAHSDVVKYFPEFLKNTIIEIIKT